MRVPVHRGRAPARPKLQETSLPAQAAGMDRLSPLSSGHPLRSVFAVNVVTGDGGLMPRPGTAEHATGVGSTAGDVRTLLSYRGGQSSKDRLFGVAPNGIYDASAGGAAPTLKHTFGASDGSSGRGNGVVVTNAAGDRFMLYADETNGYHLYTESTDTWAAGSTTGVLPTDLVYVLQWKARIWFVQRNSTKAWYLAAGAISGAATAFDFGPVFRKGGALVGLWRWTRDGGAGMDDLLVAVSSGGDVVVYAGADPTSLSLVGVFEAPGGVPAGRRIVADSGGDLLLLTLEGLIGVGKLVNGGDTLAPSMFDTERVRPVLADKMLLMRDLVGWELQRHPRGYLVVNMPVLPGETQEQLVMSVGSRAWSRFRGLDALSTCVWRGDLYLGTRDGRILRSTGTVDNVKLGGDTSQARAVECYVLGFFNSFGRGGRRKAVRHIRPVFVTRGASPNYQAIVRYDYDLTEPSGALAAAPASGSLWDTALWDSAVWGSSVGVANQLSGVAGEGFSAAVGVHFQAYDYCVLVGYDPVMWEEGGTL